MTHGLLLPPLSTKSFIRISFKSHHNHPIPNPLHFSASQPLLIPLISIPKSTFTLTHCHSHSSPISFSEPSTFIVLLCVTAVLLSLRLASTVILPDFPARWRGLAAFSAGAETSSRAYPPYLWQAIVACEDRRFFVHCGVDPVGIARAVASFSAGGGGSTITQQLVKNAFLKNERTLPRKLVEMVLSVALERKMSKQRILSCYMSKIYWGHGIYGIESASQFYFGKHPSLLTLGESALLAGIIPAPELRSPFRNPSSAKTYQARALKRMVDVGVIDIQTALAVLKQGLSYDDGFSQSSYCFKEEDRGLRRSLTQEKRYNSKLDSVWDWETQSKMWETYEWLERWWIGQRNVANQQVLRNDKLMKRIEKRKDGCLVE